ncbi:hypothetical protein WKT02_06350 [Erysipelotrichaceae bacterium HCN-30851]
MKKSNLIVGICYLLVGIISLLLALFTETKLDGLFFGFTGAGIVPGLMMIYKYFYWSSPKNKDRYLEKLENEKIEMHDELKEKVRGKAGQYAYTIGLYIISFSTVMFAILDALEIIENGEIFVFFLAGYLVFQIIIGFVLFNRLMKKY